MERVAAAIEAAAGSRSSQTCSYASGLATPAEIRAVCEAVSKPVNVLARPALSLAQIVDAGAQRVSMGGSLTWTAVNALTAAASEIRDRGDFSSLGSPPEREMARVS